MNLMFFNETVGIRLCIWVRYDLHVLTDMRARGEKV
jgi:hypothetical protein